MLDSLRRAFFLKALQRILHQQHRRRTPHNVDSAKYVGLLFDATNTAVASEVLALTTTLENSGKKVRLLGFATPAKGAVPPEFPYFSPKDCRWTGEPSADTAAAFARETFDLLLCFNPEGQRPLHAVAAASNAAMKIGYATSLPNDFDLLLDTATPKHFLQQLEPYLDTIVLTHHESAGAL